jgi:hypothetical protein
VGVKLVNGPTTRAELSYQKQEGDEEASIQAIGFKCVSLTVPGGGHVARVGSVSPLWYRNANSVVYLPVGESVEVPLTYEYRVYSSIQLHLQDHNLPTLQ